MFTKLLTAGVLSISLSLTSLVPTQAQASFSEEDAVFGILTLLLVGAAIHHSRDRDEPAQPVADSNAWRDLPIDCLRHATRRNGNTIRFFGQRCMNNNFAHVSRLPDRCHVQFRNANNQRRAGWRAGCLRNEGFRFNRH